MKRAQILFFTLLFVLFCLAGCKSKGKTESAAAKPATASSKAAAKSADKKAVAKKATVKKGAAVKDDDLADEPLAEGKKEKLTGVYAAATKAEPETKDDNSSTPTVTDFEEEVISKITPLNFDEELKTIEELVSSDDDEDDED